METIDFDPNQVLCGRVAKQRFKLTFGDWKYRTVEEVEIVSNMRGLDAIRFALEKLIERLEEGLHDHEPARLVMTNSEGETLYCEDDEMQRSEWLADLLVSAELVAYEPGPRRPVQLQVVA